ncbi:MAG: ABC transporter substrate binding protein, partial [Alphaproteobacteria bacterium]|nr:ABC transporter substrate binding protein [Alphaproteobacteria bacterium]
MPIKKIIPIIILCVSVFFYAFTTRTKNTNLIAITQIAPHPSLDCIRQGFLDVFQKAYPNYQIDYQNAQGSQPLSIQIAQKFASQNPRVIVAITTPSAMASYQVAK